MRITKALLAVSMVSVVFGACAKDNGDTGNEKADLRKARDLTDNTPDDDGGTEDLKSTDLRKTKPPQDLTDNGEPSEDLARNNPDKEDMGTPDVDLLPDNRDLLVVGGNDLTFIPPAGDMATPTCAQTPMDPVLFGTFYNLSFEADGAPDTFKLPKGFVQSGTVTLPNGYFNSLGNTPGFSRGTVSFVNEATGDTYTKVSTTDTGGEADYAIDYEVVLPAGTYKLTTTIEFFNDAVTDSQDDSTSLTIAQRTETVTICGDNTTRHINHASLPQLQSRTVRIGGVSGLGAQALLTAGRLRSTVVLDGAETAGNKLVTVQVGSSLVDSGNTIVYANTALPTVALSVKPTVIVEAATEGLDRDNATNGWRYLHTFDATLTIVGVDDSNAFLTAPALSAANLATLSGTITDGSGRLAKEFDGFDTSYGDEELIQGAAFCNANRGYFYFDALGYSAPVDKGTCDTMAAYAVRVPLADNAGTPDFPSSLNTDFPIFNDFVLLYTSTEAKTIAANAETKNYTVPTTGTEVSLLFSVVDANDQPIEAALVSVESSTALTGVPGHFLRTGAFSDDMGELVLQIFAGTYTVTVDAL